MLNLHSRTYICAIHNHAHVLLLAQKLESHPCKYTANCKSMMQNEYQCAFFTARKPADAEGAGGAAGSGGSGGGGGGGGSTAEDTKE
jgi:hypothetical protein